ncbi:MAG: U32 family peptidase, partial [Dysgonamonadaceae bacterium]|nr:U32 family peptidase [Dysgonamonadaceae bacterium]
NTILEDPQLPEAEKIIWDIYRAGADALIIQDMGILNLNLPPVLIHASTQCDNRTPEKIRFLEEAGFSQIVLARELSLEQIKAISKNTKTPLEVFIHGALCVCYSGQCYISRVLSNRSANRGECAQYCRMPYSLIDGAGKTISSNKYLLSLKDLNQSAHLEELLDAGVSSLKIEGRLKDLSYVKNITAYYRKKLDEIFERRPEYIPSSSGKCVFFFNPDPEKSFNRGFTNYFLKDRDPQMASPNTPKAIGEAIGNVKDLLHNHFTISGRKKIHNGDGLCFLNDKKELQGFRVNRVEENKIFPAEMPRMAQGITVYRNFDHEFEKSLQKKSSERKIKVNFELQENSFGFSLTVTDEDLFRATVATELKKEISLKPQQENIRIQLSKLGNTIFEFQDLKFSLSGNWFIPSSILSDMRRNGIDALLSMRKIALPGSFTKIPQTYHLYPETELNYTANVSNQKAKQFYMQHGVNSIEPALEIKMPQKPVLMQNKYCIRYQSGICPKKQGQTDNPKLPLSIITGNHQLQLSFNCKLCEMQIISGN